MKDIPFYPRMLGLGGLLPPLACLFAVLATDGEYHFAGLALGNAYAVLIFSFLGGLWWGLAAAEQAHGSNIPGWIYLASVMPSLLALVSFLPWVIGEVWPGPSLIIIGALILLSPMVDFQMQKLGLTPIWWMKLRIFLSAGLGIMAMILGIFS